jgi:G3E family GTPase
VAETFEFSAEEGVAPLKEVAKLDTCVTVLDASALLLQLATIETVKARAPLMAQR